MQSKRSVIAWTYTEYSVIPQIWSSFLFKCQEIKEIQDNQLF